MDYWKDISRQSVTTFDELKKHLNCEDRAIAEVITTYPMRINAYYLDLIKKYGEPLRRQAIPDPLELMDSTCIEDPLAEENLSPVENLVHKYPDRALLLVTNKCAMYCRFCTRKRKVGTPRMTITQESLQKAFDYLAATPQIREVLISGGDPLMLEDDEIDSILTQIRAISSIEVIRIGTRVPCTLPMRVTTKLAEILKKHHPLYINTHFNHPFELTREAEAACLTLADRGIPLGSHTVLLKGINDDTATLKQLMLGLLKVRVKPYYLFQADLTRGTNHFRTTTRKGIEIMRELIGHISGMAVPTFALDAPAGKGKIPLTPDYIIEKDKSLIFKNYCDELCSYPEAVDDY